MKIDEMPSRNWDERADVQSPSFIILHYTGTRTAEEAAERFCNDNPPDDGVGRISPHYLIDGKGKVIRFVDEGKRAWHAGKSSWKSLSDMNSASIGIEIWNSGHEWDLEDYIPEQIDVVIDLIHDIRSRWTIPDAHILAHSDIAAGRKSKTDPGEKFPWRKLEVNGIGLMPELMPDYDDEVRRLVQNPPEFYEKLKLYGYTYTDDPSVLLCEFRRHFLPHCLDVPDLDLETAAAILSLLRQVEEVSSQ